MSAAKLQKKCKRRESAWPAGVAARPCAALCRIGELRPFRPPAVLWRAAPCGRRLLFPERGTARNGAKARRNGAKARRNGAKARRNGAKARRNGAKARRNGAKARDSGDGPARCTAAGGTGAKRRLAGRAQKGGGLQSVGTEARRVAGGASRAASALPVAVVMRRSRAGRFGLAVVALRPFMLVSRSVLVVARRIVLVDVGVTDAGGEAQAEREGKKQVKDFPFHRLRFVGFTGNVARTRRRRRARRGQRTLCKDSSQAWFGPFPFP